MALYRELAEVPSYSAATFLGEDALNIHLTTRSHLLKTRLKSTKTIVLSSSPGLPVPSAELPPKSSEFWSADGKLKGVLKTIGDKRYVEVWDWRAGRQVAAKEVTEHVGDLLDDETWGSPTFSPSSSSLVFTVHRLPPKEPSKDLLVKHRFTPTWGETYRTLISPVPFLFTWSTASSSASKPTVRPIVSRDVDPTISFGQTQFVIIDGKEHLVATGYETMEDGRRYGIVYCANRRAGLWLIPCPTATPDEKVEGGATVKDLVRLTDPERSSRSPRVFSSDEGKPATLVYISNPLGGAHNSCATLHARELTSSKAAAWTSSTASDTLVESVWSPTETDFPGLYLNSLPTQPFLSLPHLGPHVVLSSTYHSRGTIYAVSLKLGGKTVVPTELTPEKESGEQPTWTVLGTDGRKRIVAVREGMVQLKGVRVGEVSGEKGEAKVKWSEVLESGRLTDEASASLATLRPSLFPTPTLPFPVQTLLLSPLTASTSSSPPALILVPHGGPHSTSITSFTPSLIALAASGFAVALVNYHGSLGFGEKAVRSLLGECGTLDVRDCLGVVEEWKQVWGNKGMKEEDWKGKLFVSGGSHGGFLTAHLTSKYPSLFTAAILRNPVTSFGENCTITDIPDWCFNEMGFDFPFSSSVTRPTLTPSAEQYAVMQAASPITHVQKVEAATLVLMGEEDRRVPPSQTKAWYHSLRARKAEIQRLNNANSAASEGEKKIPELEVECLVFPGEGHALDGVEAEVVGFEAGLDWFRDRAQL